MITASIIIGIIALLAAHQAGITATWLGTGAVTGLIMLLCILAMPAVLVAGFWAIAALWAAVTTFYHVLLATTCRRAPVNAGQRSAFVWSFGRYRVAFAVGVVA